MTHFIHRIVTNRLGRLRVCVLLVLIAGVCGMLSGAPVTGARVPAPIGDASVPLPPSNQPLSGVTVALDPGHGGYDGGARARDSGTWEKALTLAVALQAERALMERGAGVILTRREDVCLAEGDTATKARKRQDLQRRLELAREGGADVFLSIHMNEYRGRSQSGPQVFYRAGSDGGRLLAGAMQQALIARLNPPKKREALAGDYYVLGGGMPSVLVECGFLSNAREEGLLLTEAYQAEVAEAIADGVEAFWALQTRLNAGNEGV